MSEKPIISIFPLASTIFYPNTYLPLHIFEPRYRQMVAETLEENGLIGMVIFKPGWEDQYFQSPEIVSVGCAGKIENAVRLDDGKYNISLLGLNRFRIIREIQGKPYRRADVEFLENKNDAPLNTSAFKTHPLLARFQAYAQLLPEAKQCPDLDRCETLGQAVDLIAYELDMPVDQKQAFLEEQDVLRRMLVVQSMLDFKTNLINLSKNQMRQGFDTRLN